MHRENNPQPAFNLSRLCTLLNQPSGLYRVFAGFDGFIDEIIHVVDKRFSKDSYERILSIQAYSDRIAKGSGMSTNIELVSRQVKMGGNGSILAASLLNYSVDVTYMGAVGYPTLDPALKALSRCREIICLSSPAVTEALEFDDGKIIASRLASLNEVTWENIEKQRSLPQLIALFENCSYFIFSNWSMILGMNHIWEEILKMIVPHITASEKTVFFDLADPEKRTKEDLLLGLSYIKAFTKAGSHVILSMNLKEACEISEVLGMLIPDYRTADPQLLLKFLSGRLGLFCIVIHLTDRACCLHDSICYEINGPYCTKPKLTTGAGDNFNAGFLYGVMQGFSFTDCLCIGCAASGYYVRHAKSPDIRDLTAFILLWSENQI